MQEIYSNEYTEQEERQIFYQVVNEFKNFDEIFQEMRKYEYIEEKQLFVTLYNEGWAQYSEEFHKIMLSGPRIQEQGRLVRRHTQMPPAIGKRIEDFPFNY